MPRAPFTQATVKRAVSALEGMGKKVRGVEFKDDGSFLVLLDNGGDDLDNSPTGSRGNSCDEVFSCGG